MSEENAPPRSATGNIPDNLGEPHAERVLSIVMAVAGELAVMRERLDTIEQLAAERGLFTPDDIESYAPAAAVSAAREAWRKAYIRRILRVMHDTFPSGAARDNYAAIVNEIS
jgi:hypothetical protein